MLKQSKISDFFNIQETTSEEIISDKEEINNDIYELFFDGGCNPNPGKGGAGAVIYKNKEVFWKSAAYVGKKETNNVAEYVGMLIGLQEAVKKNIREIHVYGDSLLVIKQMRKEYAVNSFSLKPYNKKAFELAKQIGKVRYSHIYRDQNALADRLANEGLLLANS